MPPRRQQSGLGCGSRASSQARHHAGGGTRPVGRQHRLPHGEDLHRHRGVRVRNLFDRGCPRRQAGQVGESRRMTRVRREAWLKSAFNTSRFITVSEGCPAGALCAARPYQRAHARTTTGTANQHRARSRVRQNAGHQLRRHHHGHHDHSAAPEMTSEVRQRGRQTRGRRLPLAEAKQQQDDREGHQPGLQNFQGQPCSSSARRGGNAERETARHAGERAYQRRQWRQLLTVLLTYSATTWKVPVESPSAVGPSRR